jgi:hypothetical protein
MAISGNGHRSGYRWGAALIKDVLGESFGAKPTMNGLKVKLTVIILLEMARARITTAVGVLLTTWSAQVHWEAEDFNNALSSPCTSRLDSS